MSIAVSEVSGAQHAPGEGAWRRSPLRWRWLWLALWPLAVAAQFAVLWPVLWGDEAAGAETIDFVYRVTGGSFVLCGLIAWASAHEPRWRAHGRRGLRFVRQSIAELVGRARRRGRLVGLLFADYWAIVFVVLLAVFPHGRPLGRGLDWLVLGAVAMPIVVMQPIYLLFLEEGGGNLLRAGYRNLLLCTGRMRRSRTRSTRARELVGGLAGVLLAVVLIWRWRTASPPLRRVLIPVLAGGAAMLSFAVLLTFDLFRV